MQVNSFVGLITNSSTTLFASLNLQNIATLDKVLKQAASEDYEKHVVYMPFSSAYYYTEYYDPTSFGATTFSPLSEYDALESYQNKEGTFPKELKDMEGYFDPKYDEAGLDIWEAVYWCIFVNKQTGKIDRHFTTTFNNMFEGVEVGDG